MKTDMPHPIEIIAVGILTALVCLAAYLSAVA